MRVLQLHTEHRFGGGEDVVVDIEANLLREGGHDVEQVVARNPSTAPKAAATFASAPWNQAQARRILRAIKAFEPDVAHLHNTWFAMSPAVITALKRAGIPVVVTLHNYRLLCANGYLFRDGAPCEDCVAASPWQAVQHACYRDSRPLSVVAAGTIALHNRLGTYDDVDLFIALTEFQKDLLVRGGLPSDRVVVKPNSVGDPGPRAIAPSASKTVLYVGRLSEEKGGVPLVETWSVAPPAGLELAIVGDGPLRSRLEAEATASTVRLRGFQTRDRILSMMLESRALVVPSKWYEGLPLAVLEAFSAGLPVLASNLGGLGETVGALGEPYLVDMTDAASAWRSALSQLGDSTSLDEASVRARRIYQEKYTPSQNLAALTEAYSAAMARSSLGA